MRRRTYLAGGLAALGSLAGCTGRDGGAETPGGDGGANGTGTDPGTATGTGTEGDTGTAADENRYPVPEDELRRGAAEDAIPAIVDPAFGEDWSGIEFEVQSNMGGERTVTPRIHEDDRVIGIERDGFARAYPLKVLRWHEVCNDRFDGPLLVTYCPLCRTGVAAERTVDGETATFGVSGLLWKSNLVMYDDVSDSLWSQVAATAIRGPEAGTPLDLVPSTITTWGEWREAHPDGQVLRPPPDSSTVRGRDETRPYDTNPYGRYADADQVGLGRTDYDDRLHPKTLVVGVADADAARAYPLPAVREAGVVNDVVGDLPVVVTTDGGGDLVAYERTVDGDVLAFEAADETTLRADGSRWRRSTGRALDGPHEGTTLTRANDLTPLFWFSWADIHPDSDIYEA